MACESCRSQARLLIRAASRASRAPTPVASTVAISKRFASSYTAHGAQSKSQNVTSRSFSTTPSRSLFQGLTQPYQVVGATERLFKGCGDAANYKISADARKEDRVEKLEDGEEVGEAIGTREVWHKRRFLPSSTQHDPTDGNDSNSFEQSSNYLRPSAPGPTSPCCIFTSSTPASAASKPTSTPTGANSSSTTSSSRPRRRCTSTTASRPPRCASAT